MAHKHDIADKLDDLSREYIEGKLPAIEYIDAVIAVLQEWDTNDGEGLWEFANRVSRPLWE